MKHELPSFAVLIDADNVRLDSISPVLEEITRHARVTVRRIYGDFTSQNLAGWKLKLSEHAIHPIQQYRNTVGKNASDSALIIDAMDLLHSRRFEGFCLVSSDSDFTRLATRIREDGLVVYGFGEKKTPKAFVNACDRYIYVENLLDASRPAQDLVDAASEPAIVGTLPEPLAVGSTADDSSVKPSACDDASAIKLPAPPEIDKVTFKPPSLAVSLLLRAYTNVADEQGWAMLEQMSSYIHANHSDFDPRTYGCAKFIDLMQKTAVFELIRREYKNGHSNFCRPKTASQAVGVNGSNGKDAANKSYHAVLQEAVIQATALNGWAPISTIGQKLKALGRDVKSFGAANLTEALKASALFDMQGSGAARYFRVKAKSN